MIPPPRGWEGLPALADLPTAAALVGVPAAVMAAAVDAGDLAAARLGGVLYFRPADVMAWITAAAAPRLAKPGRLDAAEVAGPETARPKTAKPKTAKPKCPAATPVPASSTSRPAGAGTSHGPSAAGTTGAQLAQTAQALKRRSPPSSNPAPGRPPLTLVASR